MLQKHAQNPALKMYDFIICSRKRFCLFCVTTYGFINLFHPVRYMCQDSVLKIEVKISFTIQLYQFHYVLNSFVDDTRSNPVEGI